MLVQEDDSALIAMALSKSLFTAAEADEARRAAETAGRPVSEVLVERGLLAARTIDSLRAEVARASGVGANDRTVSTPPPAPSSGKLPVPCRLGDYDIVQKLGEGGMGAVYRARQMSLDREVALKVMSSHVMQEPEALERFEREARAMAKINDPHVITVYDTRNVDGRLIMSLELMRGGDASQLAEKSGGRLPEARALAIGRDCARGLQALEKAGLVHRDIKPANVFMGDDGQAKLADLGLARLDSGDDRMTKSGMVVGTPAFMAPEQADGVTSLDVRTDIYAVGATIFQLVTGSPPYTGSSGLVVISKVLTAPVPDPRALRPDVSALTAELVMKALAKDRADRFQTATELLVAVERARVALGGGRPSGRVAAQPGPARPSGRRIGQKPAAQTPEGEREAGPHPAAVGSVAALLAGIVIAAGALLFGGKGDQAPVATRPQEPSETQLVTKPSPGPEADAAVADGQPSAPEAVDPAEPEPEPVQVAMTETILPSAEPEPPPVPLASPQQPAPAPAEPAPAEPAPAEPAPAQPAPAQPAPAQPAPAPAQLPRGVPIKFAWESADELGTAALLTNGMYRVHSTTHWGRVSGNAGPIVLPARLRFKLSNVKVGHAVPTAHQELINQGFTGSYGFFYELGLRVVEGQAFAGKTLDNALWLSLNVGLNDLFGMLRAVNGEDRDHLSLDRAGRPLAPGLRAWPGFSRPFDGGATQEIEVIFDLQRTAWTCEAIVCVRGAKHGLLKRSGTWRDLGLTEAPEELWVWVHAGNWDQGRGDGHIGAMVERAP